MEYSAGWDSTATLVDGRWIDRRPRRPEVADQLRREVRFMPWLAPRLPLPVPIPYVLDEDPLVVRHDLVPGESITEPTAEHGRQLGEFLRALHECPVSEAMRHGLPSATATARMEADTRTRFRSEVVPLLPPRHHEAAVALLDTVHGFPADAVVHADLGPAHILVDDNTLTGVIDFGDVRVGDVAIDFAWCLYGTPSAFADALVDAYGVTEAQRERALVWHKLGPWHEVIYGLDTDAPELVRSGLTGALDRLHWITA